MFCFLVWLVSVQMTVTFWSYRILKKKFYKQSEEVLNWSLIFSSNFRCFFFLLRVRFDSRLCLSFKKKQVLRNPNENNFSSRTEWVTAVITGELVSAFMYIYIYIYLLYFISVSLMIMRNQPASTSWTVTSTAAYYHCWSYTLHSVLWIRCVVYIWY